MSKSQRWSVNETVILIYFSSRQIRCKALRCLLARRGFYRSPRAIKHRAYTLAKSHPELKVNGDFWDLDNVDDWVDNIAGDHRTVNELIRFGEKDAHDVMKCQMKTPC
ncbi:hypothetical protein N7478_000796 [Penicillium angulare]|uniref:uncharacterized protein n=1 Tax=Penicillium angulare TaxID=116970 RepID=UPI00254090B9|nr:uncharacterized protein N7478_000796 [Penicillium angulare]KAJ5291545.1 hypothetical protein N7478_000796 [Penicillium angulare]